MKATSQAPWRRLCWLATVALVAGCGRGGSTSSEATSGPPDRRVRPRATPDIRPSPPTKRPRPRRTAARPQPADPPASVLPAEARLPADALSELKRRKLVSYPSRWNGKVHVKQRGAFRMMYLGKRLDVVHTRLDMRRPTALISPYQRCLLTGLGLFSDPAKQLRRAVMIGLGGGALTRFFHIKRPGLTFHSVEIDPMVVAVARRFFGVKDTATYRSYAEDGRKFLADARRPYDLVIMDAFDAKASYPRQLASVEFFRLIKKRLTPQGVLIMNFLVHSRRIYADVFKTLRQVFPKAVALSMKRFRSFNVLILATADPAVHPDRATLRKRARQIKQRWGVDFDLQLCIDTLGKNPVDLNPASIIHDPQGKKR